MSKATAQERREARKAEREQRNNADIRPWVSIGEAAEIALSGIVKKKEDRDAS